MGGGSTSIREPLRPASFLCITVRLLTSVAVRMIAKRMSQACTCQDCLSGATATARRVGSVESLKWGVQSRRKHEPTIRSITLYRARTYDEIYGFSFASEIRCFAMSRSDCRTPGFCLGSTRGRCGNYDHPDDRDGQPRHDDNSERKCVRDQ